MTQKLSSRRASEFKKAQKALAEAEEEARMAAGLDEGPEIPIYRQVLAQYQR